jgi:hypothetical protein
MSPDTGDHPRLPMTPGSPLAPGTQVAASSCAAASISRLSSSGAASLHDRARRNEAWSRRKSPSAPARGRRALMASVTARPCCTSHTTSVWRAIHRWRVFLHGRDQPIPVELDPEERQSAELTDEEIHEQLPDALLRHQTENRDEPPYGSGLGVQRGELGRPGAPPRQSLRLTGATRRAGRSSRRRAPSSRRSGARSPSSTREKSVGDFSLAHCVQVSHRTFDGVDHARRGRGPRRRTAAASDADWGRHPSAQRRRPPGPRDRRCSPVLHPPARREEAMTPHRRRVPG